MPQTDYDEYPEYLGWELFKQGKNLEAIDAYTRGLAKRKDCATYNNRSLAYWTIGDFDSAMSDLRTSDELSMKDFGRSDYNLNRIGAITWIAGNHLKAAEIWSDVIRMHSKNEFSKGDAAGDIGCGLHLWFASCFQEAAEFRKISLQFLRKKAKTKAIRSFPGPMAGYILGQTHEDAILEAAKYPVPARGFCIGYFYIAMMAKLKGDDNRFRELLSKAVEYGKARMLEREYYLANHLLSIKELPLLAQHL